MQITKKDVSSNLIKEINKPTNTDIVCFDFGSVYIFQLKDGKDCFKSRKAVDHF